MAKQLTPAEIARRDELLEQLEFLIQRIDSATDKILSIMNEDCQEKVA